MPGTVLHGELRRARDFAVLGEFVEQQWLVQRRGGELAPGEQPRIEADRFEIAEDAIRYLVDATPPGSQIITDGQMIALRAGRAVPPGLTNTSRMRIKTGQLTDQAIIGIAQRTQPEAVVYWERKLELLDGFDAWVVEHYDLAVAYSERHRIYRLRPDWP